MAFGRNPHVAKAQAAEQKAEEALDDVARTMAHRDAAHQWDRAADREKPGKYKDAYLANAVKNRALADAEREVEPHEDDAAHDEPEGVLLATSVTHATVPSDPKAWN
jgi:hypothetical protein